MRHTLSVCDFCEESLESPNEVDISISGRINGSGIYDQGYELCARCYTNFRALVEPLRKAMVS